MKKLRTERLQSGMVVAKDIIDITGMLLVAKGATLNEQLITRLSKRGVDLVWIENNEEETSLNPLEIEKVKKQIAENLNKRFRLVIQDPIMGGLKGKILEYLIERRAE